MKTKRERSWKVGSKFEMAAKIGCSLFIVLMLVVNFAVGVFFKYYSLIAAPDDDDYSDVVISPSDEDLKDTSGIVIELPEESIFHDKDVLNILLIGTDERTQEFYKASRADTIMLLSLNDKKKSVKLVSFERDTYVKMPNRDPGKLNHTFQYGGAKLLMQTLGTHFGLDVEKYVRVNFSVFERLVNEIGGVDIDLTAQEASLITNNTEAVAKEGKNHLDGSTALYYSRIRYIDSDWERVKRQRRVVISIKDSFGGKSIGEIKKIADVCLPYVQTNLSALECADLLFHIADFSGSKVDQMTIPDWSTFNDLERVNFKANKRILNDFLYKK